MISLKQITETINMKPSRISISHILDESSSAVDFKNKCKSAFGWTEKSFMYFTASNHCFHLLKNNKSKEYIKKEVLFTK